MALRKDERMRITIRLTDRDLSLRRVRRAWHVTSSVQVLRPGLAAPAVRLTPLRGAEGKEKGRGVAARRGPEGGSGVSKSKLPCSWPLERRELCGRLEAQSKAAGR